MVLRPGEQPSTPELILQQLQEINAKLGIETLQAKIPVSGQIVIAALNTGIQFPKRPVPPGILVYVRTNPTNLGTIRVSGSRADVENATVGFPMIATDTFKTYNIHNLSDLWVAGTSPGDSVFWAFEELGW